MSVDVRMELPVESASLFSGDPTEETPFQAALMAGVPGAEQMFPAGSVASGPVLDIHLEGDKAGIDLWDLVVELDGLLIEAMADASAG